MLPKIIFDTTGINALERQGSSSTPIMRGLASGFEVILTGTSLGELIAEPNADKREALLCRLDWLLQSATCIWEPHEIVRRHIMVHRNDPAHFNWKAVDVRARLYEDALVRRDFPEALCLEQRKQQFKVEEQFEKSWKRLRPKLERFW